MLALLLIVTRQIIQSSSEQIFVSEQNQYQFAIKFHVIKLKNKQWKQNKNKNQLEKRASFTQKSTLKPLKIDTLTKE